MEEERLTLPWKLGCAACAIVLATVAGWLVYTWKVIEHDKSINADLGILWDNPRSVPAGVVQPTNNRWMADAFVADASTEPSKKVAVLVLDDHYRSGDPLYRSESGLIGDPISKAVLCSIPAQAKTKKVTLDPIVQRLINAQCR